VPDIIGFCNELCYNGRLIPLKKSKPGFGPAVDMVFVDNGSVKDASGILMNEEEAKAIEERVRNPRVLLLH
jgi:hypothetical protein